MPILGLRHTANFVTNERPENWRQALLRNYPNGSAPLTALTSLMKSETTDDPVFHWWQKNFDDRRLKIDVAADVAIGATSITLDTTFKSAYIVKAGDLLMIDATQEIVRVATDPTSPGAVTVTRAQAGTSAAAVTVQSVAGTSFYMFVIGSAFEEGSLAPTGVNYDPVDNFNYTQIFRNTLEMTRTASKTKLRTTEQVKEAKRECLELHSVDIERALWFGRRSTGVLNGKPYRTTAGLEAQIIAGAPANVIAAPAGGLIDYEFMETNLELLFRFGSSEKMAWGSNIGLLALNQVARKNATAQWSVSEPIKEYGMAVVRIVTPFGEIAYKTHPLFNQMRGGTNGGTAFDAKANNIYFLDMGQFIYRNFTGDDFRYEKDLTPVGLDGMKSGYITEAGMELHHPENHMIWTGVRGGAADA